MVAAARTTGRGRLRGSVPAVLATAAALLAGACTSVPRPEIGRPVTIAGPSSPRLAAPYRIEPGDQLAVTFPYNPELNLAGPVGPDGRFVMPLAGNLPLGGLTIEESAATIGSALRRGGVVEDARPTVSVQQYGAVVYVGGEVRQPGPVKLPGRMDPLQAVIGAGGLLETARSKRVVVLHREPDGRITRTDVDLRAYAHDGVATGVALRSQDIVFVPRSSIAEADLWVDQHINRLLPFSRSLNYQIGNNNVGAVVGP